MTATLQRDPETERLWFSVTAETVDDMAVPFDRPMAGLRHHGEIVAYYSGWNGTLDAAMQCARESIPARVNALCGIKTEVDYPSGLFKGPEDF